MTLLNRPILFLLFILRIFWQTLEVIIRADTFCTFFPPCGGESDWNYVRITWKLISFCFFCVEGCVEACLLFQSAIAERWKTWQRVRRDTTGLTLTILMCDDTQAAWGLSLSALDTLYWHCQAAQVQLEKLINIAISQTAAALQPL